MATLTLLAFGETNAGNSAGIETFTSASITPGTNCALVLLFGSASRDFTGEAFDGATAASSGSGPTWANAADTALGQGSAGGTIHTATIGGSSPGSFTVTWTSPGGEIATGFYAIVRVTGHDTGTPFAGAVVEGNQGDGAQSLTLGATPTVGDIVIGMVVSYGDNQGAAFDTGFTELQDFTGTGFPWQQPCGGNIGYRDDTTSTTISWSDVSSGYTGTGSAQLGMIVKNAAGAAPTSAPPRRRLQSLKFR